MKYDKDKINWLEYDLFSKFDSLFDATFLRHGGRSEKEFASLNLSDSVGDHLDSVKVNREMVEKIVGAPIVYLKQMHSTKMVRITRANLHKPFEADCTYTTEKGIALAVLHADCQAALLYDPKTGIIAAVHAGWKGLCQDFYRVVVETLKRELSVNPKDLLVAVSPSLGAHHSEFADYKKELPEAYWEYQIEPKMFDLRAIGRKQLTETGVLDNHIEFAEICTFEHPEDCYSHRRDHRTGRNASVIALK